MKIKRFLMGVMAMMLVALSGLYFISCRDDDDSDKKELVNNGGENNGGEKIDVPQELLGAWICIQYMNVPQNNEIYVFNADGTGKILYGVNTSNNTAQRVSIFDYTYNRQKSTLTIHYNLSETTGEYVLAFLDDKTMTLTEIFNGIPSEYYVYLFNCYKGSLPTVDAIPSTPTGVTASADSSSISVSWQSVSGVNSYKIYRSSSANGSYSLIGTVSSASYRDYSPMSGYNYYKVSAVNDKGESQQSSYASCYFTGEGGGGNSALSTPTGVTATVDGSSILVSWQSVNGADIYMVYRSSSANGSYSIIGTTPSTKYSDNSPISGYNYYKVSACNKKEKSQQSNYVSCYFTDDGGGANSVPSTPTGLSAVVDGSSISVSWQSVSGANSYNIYRSLSAYGSYSLIGTASSASYRDYSPMSGYNYYKVSAVNDKGESQQSNYAPCNYTDGGGDSTVPNAPTGITVSNEGNNYVPYIRISWSSVSNATSYKVYRSSSANGSYSQIGSSTPDTYMYDNNPMSGNNYYKVKAVNSAGESPYSSYVVYNNNPEFSPCPPTVKVSGTTSQTVTWTNPTSNGCGKPTSYEVYKEDPYTGKYELKKTTTTTSYSPLNSDIHPGMNMYAIKAINNSGSDVGYAYSQEVTLAKPSSFSAQKQGSNQIKFTWSKVAWATGYQIFMSTSASGSYYIQEQVDDGNQTSVTINYPGTSGTTYYFKIRAIHQSKLVSFTYSDYTTYKSVKF